jgi:hypothetical protein
MVIMNLFVAVPQCPTHDGIDGFPPEQQIKQFSFQFSPNNL